MKQSLSIGIFAFGLAGFAAVGMAASSGGAKRVTEDYEHVPMPPGVQVVSTEIEGPVFADAQGHTLYDWPLSSLRVGFAGDPKGKSACTDKVTTKTGGLMSPYPGGLDLPDLDKRRSCVQETPPFLAGADAKPVGKWTIVDRPDGKKQWAYNEQPVYTSIFDHAAGDVNGGTRMLRPGGDTPAVRLPVGPPPSLPPGFEVGTSNRGRMLLNDKRYSVYVSDADGVDKSNCFGACAEMWHPILAAATAQPVGDWTIIQRAAGVRQWAFRHKPVYTYSQDVRPDSEDGGDVPGWHNAYTQIAPNPPKGFTVQNTLGGDVLADAKGHTIYIYTCSDDSFDQLACDTLDSPQQYRLAICGGFDVARCQNNWRYVTAEPNAKSDSKVWSIVDIDPKTDRRAEPGQAGAIKVWAYRDRPVWTYAGDQQAGDYNGNGNGEWQGRRNGFRVFWIRDEFGGRFG